MLWETVLTVAAHAFRLRAAWVVREAKLAVTA